MKLDSRTRRLTGAVVVSMLVLAAGAQAAEDDVRAPVNVSRPALAGLAQPGAKLEVVRGAWRTWAKGKVSFSYQWQRCESGAEGEVGECRDVTGATTRSYTVAAGDGTLRVQVLAANASGVTKVATEAVSVDAAPAALKSLHAPVVVGVTREGRTLQAAHGVWSGPGDTAFALRWLRCDEAGGSCKAVGTKAGYELRSADVGHRLKLEVLAEGQTVESEASQIVQFDTSRCTVRGAGQLVGTESADVICGSAGDDTIYAGDGDVVYAGDGDDVVFGTVGTQVVYAGRGDDAVYGGLGRDLVLGADGHDRLFGGPDSDVVLGGRGADYLEGNWGHDVLLGGPSLDYLRGGSGDDTLTGVDGQRDWLRGEGGANTLRKDASDVVVQEA